MNTELVGIYNKNDKKINVPKKGIILEKHLAQAIGANKGDTVKIKGHKFRIEDISTPCVSRLQYMSYD